MTQRPRLHISFLVHGYPPHENAGTERHTEQLVHELIKKGHIVQVIAATRSVLHQHGEILQDHDHVFRIVNNIPARPLAMLEIDSIIGDKIHKLWQDFQPQIIHVQHLQFLTSDLCFP